MQATELLRELKRNVHELAALHELGKALTSTLELPQVLALIMEKVGLLVGPAHYSLLLAEDDGRLRFELAAGAGMERLVGQVLQKGEGLAGQAAQTGLPVLVADAQADARFAKRFDMQLGFTTGSVLALPLRARGRTLGVLELVNGAGAPAFTEEDLRTLTALGDYASIAIDNARNFARVQELTVVDEHTGLFNARHLRAVLAAEVRRAERFRHPVSLVFFDLDRLKAINDAHGHLVGSAVLREVGERLRGLLRGTDVPTRYGGDEFAVVLPETDGDAAQQAAERWRVELASAPFGRALNLSLEVTASFGVATMPDDATNAEALLSVADAATYRAKRRRNAVERASGE